MLVEPRLSDRLVARLPAEGSLEIASGATATLPDTRLLTVVGAAGTTHPDVWVTLVDMATGRFAVEQSDGAGGFLLTLDDVEPGSRVALSYGDTLAASHEPWLRFSERVVAPESILSVSTREPGATAWRPVAVEFATFDAGQGFRFAPAAGWAKGDYRVRLQPEDLAGNVETSPIYVHFEVLGGAELGDLETPFFDDTVRFGGLIYAAARQDGVRIYDVSAPRAPRPWLGLDTAFGFAGSPAMRGVATDVHGRLDRSAPVVLVADPRASVAFTREVEELEGDLCVARCDQVGDDGAYLAEPTPAARFPALLSGDRVTLDLGAAKQAQVAEAFPLLNAANRGKASAVVGSMVDDPRAIEAPPGTERLSLRRRRSPSL